MRTLCILLTDPIAVLKNKGEVKHGYYNPAGFFNKVYFIQYSHDGVPDDAAYTFCAGSAYEVIRLGPVNVFNAAWQLVRTFNAVRRIRPSLLRAYDPSLRGFFCVVCANALRIPSVISLHSHLDEQRRSDPRFLFQVRRFFEYISMRSADLVICVSEYVREYAVKYGARNTRIVYNGVDRSMFGGGARRDLFARDTVLCVARMEEPKYQECLIRAMKDVDADLVLIGRGEKEGFLTGLIADLGLGHKVRIIPSVPHSRLCDYYASARVFAIATRFEGFCIPLIEAMSLGTPVVASDIPPVREILGGCGLLARNIPGDFSKHIRLLLDDHALSERVSCDEKRRAMDFDMTAVQNTQAQIYEKLLAQ